MGADNNVASLRIERLQFPQDMGLKRVGELCSRMSGCSLAPCMARCGSEAKNSYCLGNDICCCKQ